MLLSLTTFLIYLLFCDATNPTLTGRINLAGFDFLKKAGHHIVDEEIPKIQIPEIKIPITGGPGSGHVIVENMQVTKFKTPVFDFDLSPNGISWQSREGIVKILGDWKAEYTMLVPLYESGWVRALAADIRVNITANATVLDGRPQIGIRHCQAEIQFIDIEIGGGVLPWLVNLFRAPLSKLIKKAIHEQACSTASTMLLTEANEFLHSLPLHIPIGHDFYVDYVLNGNPVSTNSYVEASFVADVVYGDKKCALVPEPMGNDPGPSPRMVTVWVSSQVANCLFESAHIGKLIQYTVTKEIEQVEKYLRTSCSFVSVCIGRFFNKLKSEYPNKYIDLYFHTATAPKIIFEADLATLNTTFAVDLFINPRKENPTILARLELTSISSVLLYLNGSRVVGTLNGTSVSTREVFSNIGEVSTTFLSVFEKFFTFTAEFIANLILKKGLEIPVFENVTLTNSSTINIFDGFIRVNADFEYLEL